MTKSEFIEWMAKQEKELLNSDVQAATDIILDFLSESLSLGRRIEVRGFGSFSLRYKPSRLGRNPKTGEEVHLASKYIPYFKAGKELRQRVNHQNFPPPSF